MVENISFYRNNPTVKFLKDETILLKDVIPKYIYCIKSGVVQKFSLSSNGIKQSISFEIIDDIFPKSFAFSKTTKTIFEYRAFTNCELYLISVEDFKSQLAYNFEFTKKMLSRAISTLMGNSIKIDALEKSHAEQKIIHMFRYLCLIYGTGRWNGLVRIEVPLTQQDLAELTGLTRETINMELSKLIKLKIASSYQKHYTIDTIKLNELADSG